MKHFPSLFIFLAYLILCPYAVALEITLDSQISGKGFQRAVRDMVTLQDGPEKGSLLIATWGEGLFILRDHQGKLWLRPLTPTTQIPLNRINEFHVSGKNVWMGTFRGIFLLDSIKMDIIPGADKGFPPHPVHGIWSSGEFVLVGTTGQGLMMFHPSLGKWITLGKEQGIHCNWINSVSGTEENLLAGTLKGAYSLNLKPCMAKAGEASPRELLPRITFLGGALSIHPVNSVRTMGQDLYAGTSTMGLILRSQGRWKQINKGKKLPCDEITDLEFSPQGETILIGTRRGAAETDCQGRVLRTWTQAPENPAQVGHGELWVKSVAWWQGRRIAGTADGILVELLENEKCRRLIQAAAVISP